MRDPGWARGGSVEDWSRGFGWGPMGERECMGYDVGALTACGEGG